MHEVHAVDGFIEVKLVADAFEIFVGDGIPWRLSALTVALSGLDFMVLRFCHSVRGLKQPVSDC